MCPKLYNSAAVKKDNNKNIWHSTPISTFIALSKWHEPDITEVSTGYPIDWYLTSKKRLGLQQKSKMIKHAGATLKFATQINENK